MQTLIETLGTNARAAAAELAFATPEAKSKALEVAAEAVWAQREAIIAANAEDQALAGKGPLGGDDGSTGARRGPDQGNL